MITALGNDENLVSKQKHQQHWLFPIELKKIEARKLPLFSSFVFSPYHVQLSYCAQASISCYVIYFDKMLIEKFQNCIQKTTTQKKKRKYQYKLTVNIKTSWMWYFASTITCNTRIFTSIFDHHMAYIDMAYNIPMNCYILTDEKSENCILNWEEKK